MREIRTLRAMRRGLETAYGAANEALPKETGSQRLGCTYETSASPRPYRGKYGRYDYRVAGS